MTDDKIDLADVEARADWEGSRGDELRALVAAVRDGREVLETLRRVVQRLEEGHHPYCGPSMRSEFYVLKAILDHEGRGEALDRFTDGGSDG